MPEALSKGEVIFTLSCPSPITLRFTQRREGLSVDITAGNTVPGMDGPLSEDQHLSPSSEITLPLRVQSLSESSRKLDYSIARE
ncbi:hypothetical protein NHJ13734_008810 [Beauveria thailandica]